MFKRIISISVSLLILISLCGCNNYVKYKIFDTDVYGSYAKETFIENGDEPLTKQELTILQDNTYEYYIYQKSNEDTQQESISGEITINKINDDISKITLSNYELSNRYSIVTNHIGSEFYKYKNLLGDYIQTENSQIKNHSEFLIPMDDSGEYYLRFTEDGMCKSDNMPNEEQYYYKYKVKSDIILIDYGYGFQPEYYIVEDGVFCNITLRKTDG